MRGTGEILCVCVRACDTRKNLINFIGLHFNFHEVIYIINAIAYRVLDCEMSFDDMVGAVDGDGGGGAVLTKMMTIVLDTNLRPAHPIAI